MDPAADDVPSVKLYTGFWFAGRAGNSFVLVAAEMVKWCQPSIDVNLVNLYILTMIGWFRFEVLISVF